MAKFIREGVEDEAKFAAAKKSMRSMAKSIVKELNEHKDGLESQNDIGPVVP